MFEAASLLGPCLLALGLVDTRARLMTLLLVLVWGEAALFDLMVSRDMAVMMKPLIDFTGGIMALGIVTRERWSVMVPALFAVMLLCHSAYWLAWHNGIDLWYVYAHALTALWLFQCAAVAWPSGGKLVGIAGAWYRNLRDGWSRVAGVGVGQVNRAYRFSVAPKFNRRPDERANRSLQISASE